MKEKKTKSGMSRIFELATGHKRLLAVSGVLAALAAIACRFTAIKHKNNCKNTTQ